jgi:uncharacterized protein (TIGR02246 family)
MSEQQIRARFEEFAAAWNVHDVAAMAGCFLDGGNVTHPWGTFAVGREAIASLLDDEHRGPMRDSRYRLGELQLRTLSERATAAECDGVLEGVRAPNGSAYDLPHRINAVLVDSDEGWRFMSMSPTVTRAGR